jgi:Fe-S-cluster-containing dehydrogenase component
MPTEKTSRREVINALKQLPSIAPLLAEHEGHYEYELDLEVVVYGRNYNGKKVGPYVRLLSYQPGETVAREGEWGGNTFYLIVKGCAEVLRGSEKVAELKPGAAFGQLSLLAGVRRNATVKAPSGCALEALEVQRPALRLLRKLPVFGEQLDAAYRAHGRDAALEELRALLKLSPEQVAELRGIAQFRTFAKNHVLCRAGAPVNRIYLIKEGWLRRTLKGAAGESEDLLGRGHCFGLEALSDNVTWPYTITLLGRTELLEISVVKLRQNGLARTLPAALARFAPPAHGQMTNGAKPEVRARILTAAEDLIQTGLVDANNLLVMDMDLCVRCGNCSLACHRTHGQSRLVRRGINITRLAKPTTRAAQSLLAPEVCLHCKDPECLTGCPTGAISRLAGGQIDINQSICIGCGDCATQCPYDAISMIPRTKPPKTAPANGWAGKLRGLLRLSPDPLPPAVETVDDLVAVKCNLCSDSKSLNPPGSRTRKYSCEENCPTGALARVKPQEYFDEIKQLEGLLFTGPRQAVGRNLHLSDWPKRALHAVGVALTLLSTLAALYGIQQYELGQPLLWFLNMRWLTGLAGLFGLVGVMLYPYRRQIYARRAGPLRYWLLAHGYLGVLAAIMLLLHGGSEAGGLLTASLMVTFDLVLLTGLFGICCYQLVPRLLTKIEATPLLLDDLLKRRAELKQELAEVAQAAPPHFAALITGWLTSRFLSLGYLLRQYWKREPLAALLEEAKAEVAPQAKRASRESLRASLEPAGLGAALEQARRALKEPEAEERILNSLASLEQRRQFKQALEQVRQGFNQVEQAAVAAATLRRVDALIYLHRSLKLWLPPHVATTALMLALLVVHIVQVIYFAAR